MIGILRFAAKNLINYELQKLSYYFNRSICRPTQIFFRVTNRCCLRCKMCNSWKPGAATDDELSTVEWKRIILEFKHWLKDSFYIQFTGGEPFLRSDMIELIRFASSLGLKTLLNSNGLLIDEQLAKNIAASGLDYLTISLDGIRAETFDNVRGVQGAHQRVTEGIVNANRFKRKGMMVGISAVVSDRNLQELVPIARWAEENGLDRVGFHALHQTGDPTDGKEEWYETSELWVKDLESLENTIDDLIRLKAHGSPIINSIQHLEAIKQHYKRPGLQQTHSKCMVGLNNFRIASNGEVKSCPSLDAIGNAREESVLGIWHSHLAKERRLEIRSCTKRCTAKCLYKQSFMEKVALFHFLLKKGCLN